MFKCEICGRESNKKIRYGGYILCSKHMHQLQKYGEFKDNTERTQSDLNEFKIVDNMVVFDLYDTHQYKKGEFIIDLDDLELVRYHRWRASYGHIVSGSIHNTIILSRLIMNCTDPNMVVDHINGNGFDNRKQNLRICTQQQNVLNKSFVSNNTTGFIGIYPEKRKDRKANFVAEIRINNIKFNLGSYILLEEAVYARWIGEIILFGKYRNSNNDAEKFKLIDNIPEGRKCQISTYVSNKINRKLNRV